MPTIQQRLDEARAAYHALMTGTSVVEVRDGNGESVRYTQINANRLTIYIRDLEAQIAEVSPAVVPMVPFW